VPVLVSCEGAPTAVDDPDPIEFELVNPTRMESGCIPWPTCARALNTDPNATPGSSSEFTYVRDAILALDECGDMQDFLQGRFDAGRIMAYDTDDGNYGWLRFEGTDSVTITLNATNFSNFTVVATLRHEYGHSQIDESTMTDQEAEDEADTFITSCDGAQT
jgi:hypothetical protein